VTAADAPDTETDAIAFVLALAKALHRYGTPAHRLEEAMKVIAIRLDLECEVFTTPTAIIMSFGEPTHLRTRLLRVEGGELDMNKLELVDDLADDVAAQKVSPAEGVLKLDEILAAPRRYGNVTTTAMHAVTCSGMAVFFGGGAADVALAGAVGVLLGLLASVAKRSTDQARVFELVGAAFVAFAAGCASSVFAITPSLVTVAALIVLLPGLSLTVAMTELATRHLMAGTARLMQAVIVFLELVVGVALGERLARAVVHVEQAVPVALPAWSQWLALVASSIGIAVVLQAQLRAFAWIVAACAVGYVGSSIGTRWLDPQMGVVVGAFAVGILGNVFARLMERPAQVVQVPAMLLLVPGSMGFRGMTSLLGHDTLSGVETVFAMFVVAFAIVAGMLIANAVVSPRRSL
jgi:uncharacterized membrane protein YjjP (DUF1212 family)